jgi:tetratricopeptide (TPR) repeat protein
MTQLSVEEVLAESKKLRKAGMFRHAIDFLTDALRMGANARLLFSRGITFDLLDETELAVQDFTSAIRLDETQPKYYFERGCVLSHSLKRDDEAIRDFDKVLEFEPDNVEAHRQCCLCLLIMGRPNRALEHAEAALRLDPDEGGTYFCLGEAYMSLQRFDEAVASFKRALELDPTQDHYSSALNRALENAGAA